MSNSFFNACASKGPLQFRVRAPSPSDSGVRLLQHPFAVVGRDYHADLVLDHRLVSRRHLYLQLIEGQLYWVDLESRVGTSSDGKVQKSGWLDPGKVIRVGCFELQWVAGNDLSQDNSAPNLETRDSPFLARSYGSQPLPDVSLEFLNGPSRATSWPMNRMMSMVGSAEGNKFRLADPSVSPHHCSLLRTPLGLWVIDLLGIGGIAVNDAAVRSTLLADGDVLRVGRYRIRIHSQFARLDSGPADFPDGHRSLGIVSSGLEDTIAPPISTGLPVPLAASLIAGRESWRSPLAFDSMPQLVSNRITRREGAEDNEPMLVEKSELTESVLVPLLNQFGSMQQQMMDQFQQAISMLVQMFGTLHRDQMSVIREELDQLRDLTKEFHELKQELAARSAHQTEKPPEVSPAPVAHVESEAQQLLRRIKERPQPQASPAAPSQAPQAAVQPAPAPAAKPRTAARDKSASAPEGPVRAAVPVPPEPTASSVKNTTPASAPLRPPAAASATADRDANRDVIIWLHQRMATLQQERETRWQKILKLLPGLS